MPPQKKNTEHFHPHLPIIYTPIDSSPSCDTPQHILNLAVLSLLYTIDLSHQEWSPLSPPPVFWKSLGYQYKGVGRPGVTQSWFLFWTAAHLPHHLFLSSPSLSTKFSFIAIAKNLSSRLAPQGTLGHLNSPAPENLGLFFHDIFDKYIHPSAALHNMLIYLPQIHQKPIQRNFWRNKGEFLKASTLPRSTIVYFWRTARQA